jgi:glycosyltransferase involved in cell wall biosynthesis
MIQLNDAEQPFELIPYPIDMSSFLTMLYASLDRANILSNLNLTQNHPTTIAQYALVHWNKYCTTNDEDHCDVFLKQAYLLVGQETPIGDASGWPISFYSPVVCKDIYFLSALTQGLGISVLVRAYQISHEDVFLELAHRIVRTFEKDILDGGVSAPIGVDGIFFEEVAVYPATHALIGFIFALFGLYDYLALNSNIQIEKLLQRSLKSLHNLIDAFDTGFWTYTDLLHRRLASPSDLALQIALLEALARYSGSDDYLTTALRWKSYQRGIGYRMLYLVSSRWTSTSRALLMRVRTALFRTRQAVPPVARVCIALPAFPVTGGMRTVLAGVAQATADIWQIEYMAHSLGPNPDKLVLHQFGTQYMASWQFPSVWLYVMTGFRKLISLMHSGADYDVILPQDGIYTAAFAALAAKLTGVRVVCIDHGTLTFLKNRAYRAERLQSIETEQWSPLRRLIAHIQYRLYWPSLSLLTGIAVRLTDHFLIPGVEGDTVEESCNRLGIHPSRITRFGSMVNIENHIIHGPEKRAELRNNKGITANAIIITMICRLAPEKSIDIALEAVSLARSVLPPTQRSLLRMIIAGDGPLRKQVEADICRLELEDTCVLWGETSREDVFSLLSISDIFMYTSRRGACFSMAVLEAMASSCAVIASTEPISNAHLLSEGRGIALHSNEPEQFAMAIGQLVNDTELRTKMGLLARSYIAEQHSATMFRRALLRTTYWSGFDEILDNEEKLEVDVARRK